MPGDTPFDAALDALDVEPTHHTDRMVTTYDILGLDAVRAAHRAEVERAVAAEREACAKVADQRYPGAIHAPCFATHGLSAGQCTPACHTRAAAAIRARGVAKRTDGEPKS